MKRCNYFRFKLTEIRKRLRNGFNGKVRNNLFCHGLQKKSKVGNSPKFQIIKELYSYHGNLFKVHEYRKVLEEEEVIQLNFRCIRKEPSKTTHYKSAYQAIIFKEFVARNKHLFSVDLLWPKLLILLRDCRTISFRKIILILCRILFKGQSR